MKTALIVDSDLSFGFWLARGLDQAGYQAYPSKSVADAIAMVGELRLEIDLLILNAALADSAEWIETLRRSSEHLRVIALIGDQPRLPGIAARVDLCCRKPDQHDDARRRDWIAHAQELLPVGLFGAAFDTPVLLKKCAGALVWRANRTEPAPVPVWKEWEGRTIDGRYCLAQCLGSADRSAVFLTERRGAQPAAIKVVAADAAHRDLLLSRWEHAAGLSHPGLVRLFDMGSCESSGTGVSYLVMECAEENLAEVLKQRPLSATETKELLEPVLDALAYVHSRGLVHGRIQPSNILAVSERLKISSDGLCPAGERVPASPGRRQYDPPERTAGFVSPAVDVWSLGITMVEALTQRPLTPKRQHKPPALPVTLPPLFLDMARQCLQPDPERRETVEHLAGRLREAPFVEDAPGNLPRRSAFRLWPFSVPAVALGVALSGILLRPHQTPAAASSSPPPPPPAPAAPPPPPADAAPVPEPAPPDPPPPPAVRHVSEQVLPEVSSSARDSIQGMLQVRIRARVDSSGTVVDAKLDGPSPSKYFVSHALDAAKRWKFDPLPDAAQAAPEDWILRFDFSKTGTDASGERVAP